MINITFTKGQQSTKITKRVFKISRMLSKWSRFRLTVKDGATTYLFHPKNAIEYYRFVTFFTKEEGTLEWLRNTLRDGDVFCDIGANVGLYSLYAAKQGKNVRVYAFEPHKFTFINLMENIRSNNLLKIIFPIAIPLHKTTSVSTMNYAYADSGSSMSQLGHKMHPKSGEFQPELEEIVYCVALDELVEKGAVPAPTVIKMDVDGNELKILKGMSRLLASTHRPRSIQVEINPGQKSDVTLFMAEFGYQLDHAHFTAGGNIKIENGANPDEIAHNAVFIPTLPASQLTLDD